MFRGKRGHDLMNTDAGFQPQFPQNHQLSAKDQQQKRPCHGVSSLINGHNQTNNLNHVTPTLPLNGNYLSNNNNHRLTSHIDNGAHWRHQDMEQENEPPSYMMCDGELVAAPCPLVPTSPRRCMRCMSGEPGHINHILG